ncbi:hypothetical protein [Pseudoalteromonas prydzensis]|uniref:hypothetical protein n=1 Tax=Pseudoalteromonas prydzensis TaxID=182141 RepID=UPI0024BC316C|nr:hypothetical protein [Pseudoalteromonas prydzensis]
MFLSKSSWKYSVALTSALVLSGCASPDYNYLPETTQISEPAINSINTAYVGDVMLRQGKYSEHDSIYLPEKVEVSWAYDLHSGYYIKKGEDKDTETYMPSSDNEGGMIDKAAFADPWRAVMAYKETQELCVITAFNAASCTDNANFERRKKPILTHDSFQQTLIYSGKVGSKINIGYREFSNSLARPAFNNDVEYDLDSSNVIGYKGARIEIIEATNEHIKYKVIQNFNRAAL